jgi:hypothetical protein
VVGDQTATVGGPVITLSGHVVASAAPSWLVVQLPDGEVSTIPAVAKPTATGGNGTAATTSEAATMSEPAQFTAGAGVLNVGVGGFIAGIAAVLIL